jgi:hypothetical protein
MLTRLQVGSVYVGSAGSKVMLYIHKTVQVMWALLQAGSIYVGSAGSKVMLYIHITRQYRLCGHAYKSVQFMLAAPVGRLCCTYSMQSSTG